MTFRYMLLFSLSAMVLASGAVTVSADDALDADWSTRLLQQKALAERAQQELDVRSAAYAKAVAAGEPAARVEALDAERTVAAEELAAQEAALPRMLDEARAAGVSGDVLLPYRYAVGVSPESSPDSPSRTAPAATQ